MDFKWYASLAGIIGANMIAVEVLKRMLAKVSVLNAIPTWLWSVVTAAALTAGSKYFGLLDEAGTWFEVINQVVITAAISGGFKEWLSNGGKAIGDSQAAIRSRSLVSILLVCSLLGGAAVTSSGCALFQAKPGASVPADVEQAKLQQIAKISNVLERIGVAVKAVQTLEIGLYDSKLIPVDLHVKFQTAFKQWATAVLELKPVLTDLTKSDATRREAILSVLHLTDRLLLDTFGNTLPENVRLKIEVGLASARALLPMLELLLN